MTIPPIPSSTVIDMDGHTALVVDHYGPLDREAVESAARALLAALIPSNARLARLGIKEALEGYDVQRLNLNPGDAVLVRVKSENVSPDEAARIRDKFAVVFPHHRVLVVTGNTEILVLSEGGAA